MKLDKNIVLLCLEYVPAPVPVALPCTPACTPSAPSIHSCLYPVCTLHTLLPVPRLHPPACIPPTPLPCIRAVPLALTRPCHPYLHPCPAFMASTLSLHSCLAPVPTPMARTRSYTRGCIPCTLSLPYPCYLPLSSQSYPSPVG
jgi:hypothetical protein